MLDLFPFEPVDRGRRLIAGIVLFASAAFAIFYAFRDIVWWLAKYRLWDIEPVQSMVIIVVAPFVLHLALRLVFGTEGSALAPPAILAVIGLGVVIAGVMFFVRLERNWRVLEMCLVAGGGALALAWRRFRRARAPN